MVVTSLDHDANIRPWIWAARRAGATIRWAEVDAATGELPAEAFDGVIGERTRLVAVTAASNRDRDPTRRAPVTDRAHAVGALTYVDGVHATPHTPTDVSGLALTSTPVDVQAVRSSYGHGRRRSGAARSGCTPAKLVPSPADAPGRFERGTTAVRAVGRRHRGGRLDRRTDRRGRITPRPRHLRLCGLEEHLGGLLGGR